MTTLPDQPVRDRAIRATSRSMAVSAGAGSGKTHVLVERVLRTLLDGTPPGRVAAITFTVKAAGELVERVRNRLEAHLHDAEGRAREVVEGILAELPALALDTIHGFCGRLLRAEALAAGHAPGTEILAESLGPSATAAAYAAWRAGLAERDRELLVAIRGELEIAESTLAEGAARLLDNRDLRPAVGAATVPWAELRGELAELRGELAAALSACRAPGTCKRYEKCAPVLSALDAALALPSDEGAVRAALSAPGGDHRGGRAADWPSGGLDRVKAAVQAVRDTKPELRRATLVPLHRRLVLDLSEHYLPAVARGKREAGQVDFQDLLFLTHELLAGNPTARARLAARFDAILVDEVQDTDPVQSAIVALLSREPGEDGAWDAVPPRAGHIFAVGDAKQSIYRFRRADVAQWTALQALVASGGGDSGSLSVNFRSVPGVVGFVNRAFAGYPGYEPLVAWREPAELPPVVALEVGSVEETNDAVVRYLLHLVTRGARVVDRDEGGLRRARWGDMMVLLPSWTAADELQGALSLAGIPSVVEGGRVFFERDETRLCRAALRAIDEPGDAPAVVFVLRGLFGLSLDELARHRAAGGSWRAGSDGHPPGPVADALRVLGELGRRRGSRGLVELLDDLLEETGVLAVWSLLPRGPAMLANVDKLRAICRQLLEHVRSGFELNERLDELARLPDEDLPLAGHDADVVRVTTIFKAKGLEAPIVILPHMRRNSREPGHIVDRQRGEVLVRWRDLEPPSWARERLRDEAEEAEERRRWMYVAATRARDQLVVVRVPGADGLLAPDLVSALPSPGGRDGEMSADGVLVRRADALPPAPRDASTFPGCDALLDVPAEPGPNPARAWRRAARTAVGRARRACLPWRTVTELSASARPRRRAAGGDEAASGGGRLAGILVHRAMEALDLALPADERVRAAQLGGRELAADAGLPEALVEAVARIAGRLAAHPVVARAAAAPERWREVPFSYPAPHEAGGGVVTGTIDLLFPLDAERTRWVVADWKSALPPEGSAGRARYEAQLEHYARAVILTIAGVAPEAIERILVGPHPELPPPDPWEEALGEVDPELTPALEALRDAGAPAPEVGADVGSPVVASAVECVWEAARVAIALGDDAAEVVTRLEARGWTVVVADDLAAVAGAAAVALGVAVEAAP